MKFLVEIPDTPRNVTLFGELYHSNLRVLAEAIRFDIVQSCTRFLGVRVTPVEEPK